MIALGSEDNNKARAPLLSPSCNQVRLLRPDPLRLLKQLPPTDVNDVNRDANITRDERGYLESRYERGKPAENN